MGNWYVCRFINENFCNLSSVDGVFGPYLNYIIIILSVKATDIISAEHDKILAINTSPLCL
jgi:hypothetical protein